MHRLISFVLIGVLTAAAFGQGHQDDPAAHDAADAPAAAHAGEASHSDAGVMDFSWTQFASTLIAFAVVFVLLQRLAWPRIMKGLEEREQKIRSEVFAAEEARQRANEALQEYERSLAEARAAPAQMIEKTKAEQTRMAADLRVQAEHELNQLRETARQNIEAAKRAALSEIYAEAASLATTVATKILRRELNEDDQRRFVEESVDGLTKEYAASET